MSTSTIARSAAVAAAAGSLLTPAVEVWRAATSPVTAAEVSAHRAETGVAIAAETIRSNRVVEALVVLGGYAVLAVLFAVACRRRGGPVSTAVAVVTLAVGVVTWSGAGLPGAAGWALRLVITALGVVAVVLAITSRRARPVPDRPRTRDHAGIR